jgi:hypothetical protein
LLPAMSAVQAASMYVLHGKQYDVAVPTTIITIKFKYNVAGPTTIIPIKVNYCILG